MLATISESAFASCGHGITLALAALCHKETYAVQQKIFLLDHLVGASREPGRYVEAERLGSFQVDHELEPGGLIDRQVGGLFALENPSDVEASPAIRIRSVVAIAHQPALFDKRTVGVHVGDGVTRRERDNLLAPAREVRIATEHQRDGAP